MDFAPQAIPEVFLITPKRFGDARGYFSETFRTDLFTREVGDFTFVQDNQSRSAQVGTVRGLHFQSRPHAQGKLVRVLSGAILDVAVDIRRGSPTFGQHVTAVLTADNGAQLWVPPGFAHGFATLEPDVTVAYKVTDYYSAPDDKGLAWDDPALGIDWRIDRDTAVLSDKDRGHPTLAELPAYFTYPEVA